MINIRYVPHNAQSPEGSASSFTGVFVVNTPAHDHSGVSHLAEHMCFRGSPYYPADHELFAANALLPLSINATTYAGCTYFYVQSYNKALFTSAIQFMYSGLVNTHYSQCAFEAERNGVLVNELTMLEGNIDYANNIAIRRNDTSPMAYQHAGGFSDSVLEISFDDLIDYKKTWYDSDHITLLVSSADADGNEIISLCSQAIAEVEARGSNAKSCGAMPRSKAAEASESTLTPTENYVSTWWVPQEFTHDLLEVESLIQKNVKSSSVNLGHFFIDDEVNHADMIALRFVHNTKANAQARKDARKNVVSLLTDLNIEAKPRLFSDAKLPEAVQRLIRDFQQQTHSRHSEPHSPLKLSPFADYLCSVHVCQAGMHEVDVKNKNADTPISDNWVPTVEVEIDYGDGDGDEDEDEGKVKANKTALLATNFALLLSLDNLPVLPRLLHKLAALSVQTTQTIQSAKSTQTAQSAKSIKSLLSTQRIQNPENRFQCIGNHWVYRVDTQFHHYLIDIVTDASFWQPRTNGECYALGVAQFNGEIFIYGAQDRQASTRDLWCENTFAQIDSNAGVSHYPA
ncbi:insulinase family protein [Alteromonas sp. 1_MG-2023]|uniref:insulinase family protein n=1 Tax=Alteromonas sp. 1_MG-2023 TaxID=3062669 RepID=UPI0026E3418B|nr:insulinase family protein [Alteromonas sp. 1_MG-2023]MDO6567330.1 insulinase family protein [Alteromonas sp. 1_MG-2023]